MKRFAEVEIGIGFSLFFAAASLTSVPPAVDLTRDRVTWAEVVERNRPVWPRLSSPDHDVLALPALQAQLDAEAAVKAASPPPAFVPGSGELPVRNAADVAWSEYNHHWSGLFVLAIGMLALVNQAGVRWARHWPLMFLGLAVFLFLRSDPEVWPLGVEGFWESLRDVEVLQHRFFVLLTVLFGLFEWRVRAGGLDQQARRLGVPAGDRRGRCRIADAQPCDCQREGSAADRAHPYAACAGRDRSRMGTLAGNPARRAPGAHCRMGVASLLRVHRTAASLVSRGLKGSRPSGTRGLSRCGARGQGLSRLLRER